MKKTQSVAFVSLRGSEKSPSLTQARPAVLALLAFGLAADLRAEATEEPPLRLEAKIPLGKVAGRIDHLAVDPGRPAAICWRAR
jgi:hypothetical protein